MHNPVTMACIFHYAQVSHCKGAPTRAEQIFMHYLFYAFCSNAFCRSQLYIIQGTYCEVHCEVHI